MAQPGVEQVDHGRQALHRFLEVLRPTQRRQAGNMRRWLADHHGTTFEIGGDVHRTMVPPEVLVDLRRIPGVTRTRVWLLRRARAMAQRGVRDVSMRTPARHGAPAEVQVS